MRLLTYMVLFLIIIMGLSFACVNSEPVTINYYIGSDTLPLSMLLVMVLALGTFLGLLVSFSLLFRLKRKAIKLNQCIKLKEKEINNLRSIPLKDSR